MGDVQGQYRASYRVLFLTLWLTLLVLAVKFWAGWTSRSLSILADFLHTLLDCFSILLSLSATASMQQSGQQSGQALRTHRQQHTVAVLLLAAFLGFIGFTMVAICLFHFRDFLASSTEAPELNVDLPLVFLLSAVVAVHICLVLFERYESSALRNPTLRHSANYILQGMWLTGLMLAGLIGISQGYLWLDPLLTIVLTLMLAPSLWRILKQQIPSLVHQMAIAPETLAQIAAQVEGVSDCPKVFSQGVIGDQLFIRLYLLLHPEFMSVAHLIGERLENILRERYGAVTKVYVRNIADKSMPWQNALNLDAKKRRKR
ncbi:MAG: cation transporter [Drouetiella hepatica Uher 2000/2452]|jgi:cation diffusion facilitator family transporter|uniref:Cation transporter n=1 Tax=Drouetiella hepatica Uher 2000/2452 TaxID=904376 RepID=A0A951Q9C1_9CYAN|nr:cation transporter [Drouetiella hepatica Uher 2000/2452]